MVRVTLKKHYHYRGQIRHAGSDIDVDAADIPRLARRGVIGEYLDDVTLSIDADGAVTSAVAGVPDDAASGAGDGTLEPSAAPPTTGVDDDPDAAASGEGGTDSASPSVESDRSLHLYLDERVVALLNEAGYNTLDDLSGVDADTLIQIKGIGDKTADNILSVVAEEGGA